MSPSEFPSKGLFPRGGMSGFTLFTHLSWTGRIIAGESGQSTPPEIADLSDGLTLGSIAVVVEASSGRVVEARAHHGDQHYTTPGKNQQLVVLTAEPMMFPPRALECIADALSGGAKILDLPEVQRANAIHFLSHVVGVGIGNLSPAVSAEV